MASQGVPRSASFAFDTATRSLDEQLHRIDALDSKAAALLAADLIVTGNMLESIDTNRAKLQQKARWLTWSQIILIVSISLLGGYFVWSRLAGGA